MLNKPLCLLRGLRMYIHYWIYEDLKVYIIRKNPHRIKILVFPWLYYFPNVNYTSKKCSLTRKYQEDLHDQEIEEKRWGGNKWFRSRKWWETLNSKSAMHMGIRHDNDKLYCVTMSKPRWDLKHFGRVSPWHDLAPCCLPPWYGNHR